MPKTYIIGHRNPDTDSVCAPYAYAWLKQQIDPSGIYIPGVLGNLNPQTAYIFEALGLEAPALIRDVYPRAEDIMQRDVYTVHKDAPIGEVTSLMDEKKLRNVPIVDEEGSYLGLITMQELAHYFMPRQYSSRPLYELRPENLYRVIPGYFLQKGETLHYQRKMMVGAMAFETFISRLEASMCDDQGYPLLIVGNRPEILAYVLKRDFPILILTGMRDEDCRALDLEGFTGWIYISEVDTAETIRLLRISIPALAIANRDLPQLGPLEPLNQIKRVLLNLDHHGIAVVENDKLLGLITGSMLIDPPRHKVIMVDHNELSQSVEGIDLADIVEIIDHHRLNTIRSNQPIYVYADPLGSSCTLVYKLFCSRGLIPPREIAALLLSGILSDTVILHSPTTTAEDISAAEALGKLAGLNPADWGQKIFQNAASLSALDPDLAVAMDFKAYTEEDCRLGIAQVEVVTLRDLAEVKAAFLEALERVKAKFSLDWAMLLITDIIEQESVLLSTSYPLAEEMIYQRQDSQTYLLPGVLSRKKQLLPEILYVLKHR